MDTHTQCQPRPKLHVIPLWNVDPRPVDRERRRDPGARHRHGQAQTGVVPLDSVRRRRSAEAPQPERVIRLWLEPKDEGHEAQPDRLRRAA